MKIVVCYKAVPNADSLTVKRDRSVDLSTAEWEIGQYDLKAVEAGMQLSAAVGGSVVALTAGGEIVSNSKLKKAILSRGPAEMFGVQADALAGCDTLTTAEVLAAAVAKIGDVDLILCGEGSGDAYAQQVGNTLGGLLDWNTVNAVSGIQAEEGGLRLERSLEDGTEVISVQLPAVISVTSDINIPRIPTMKDIMGAGKKPATIWSVEDVAATVTGASETVSVLAPEQTDRRKIIFDSKQENAVSDFAAQLAKLI